MTPPRAPHPRLFLNCNNSGLMHMCGPVGGGAEGGASHLDISESHFISL